MILFGSRARRNHRHDSDADLAVLLHGESGRRVDAPLWMADIAFDVMLETGALVEAIPLWEDEWEHPERFSNPALIENSAAGRARPDYASSQFEHGLDRPGEAEDPDPAPRLAEELAEVTQIAGGEDRVRQ